MEEINITHSTPNINIDTATRTYHLPIASETQLGGIKVGNNLTIEEDGTLNAEATEYDLPVATSSTLGGVKIGSGLTMTDQVLSVNVDSVLSNTSSNPLRNSVVTSNISTLTTGLQTASSSITTLSENYTALNSTVGGHTMDIQSLNDGVYQNTLDIQTNADNISNNTLAIQNTDGNLSDLADRVSTAEGDITDIEGDITDIQTDVTALSSLVSTEITYSYLLPVSTWSDGKLTYEKRGKSGVIYFDLTGSCTLAANTSTVLHTFTGIELYTSAINVILSDAGPVLASIDDTTGELSIVNMSSSSITITSLKGSIPLIF